MQKRIHAAVKRVGCSIQAALLMFLAVAQGTEVCFCSLDENNSCVECASVDDHHGFVAEGDSSAVHIEASECHHLTIEMPDVGSASSNVFLPDVVYLAPPYPSELELTAASIAYVPPCATSPPSPGGSFVDYSVRVLQRS